MLAYEGILNRLGGDICIEPFNIDQLGPNSYDLRLGNWFFELTGYRLGLPQYQCFWVPDGDPVYIPTGGMLLGMTKERAGSRRNIVPILKTKSTIGRLGIDLCRSAGLGDIGYYGQPWTLEITSSIPSSSPEPAQLIVGSPVAQIYFDVASETEHPYQGQYLEHEWPLCMLPKKVRPAWEGVVFYPGNFPYKPKF